VKLVANASEMLLLLLLLLELVVHRGEISAGGVARVLFACRGEKSARVVVARQR
jgi:hypothetical protein